MTRSGRDRVIMLTRYPVPGTTKRRLSDALGPGGAAMLHRDLAAYCFRRLAPMAATGEAVVEVRFEGGTEHDVREWLGGPAQFKPQGPGHLGDRLRAAAQDAFAKGAERVVLLGSDCPDAGAPIVRRALVELDAPRCRLRPCRGRRILPCRAQPLDAARRPGRPVRRHGSVGRPRRAARDAGRSGQARAWT